MDQDRNSDQSYQGKGLPMEGIVARWYAGVRGSQVQLDRWREQAAVLTASLPDAPGFSSSQPGRATSPSSWRAWADSTSPGWTSAAPS